MIEAEENVIVVVRVRPIQKSEESKGEKPCVESVANGKEIQVKTGPLAAEVYKCNGCFPRETTQVCSVRNTSHLYVRNTSYSCVRNTSIR